MKRRWQDCLGVYVKKSSDGEPMYRNYDGDCYETGEIVAIFGDMDDAREYAKTFKGYCGNVIADVTGVHRLTWPGDNYKKFWKDEAEPYLGEAFSAYWTARYQETDDGKA